MAVPIAIMEVSSALLLAEASRPSTSGAIDPVLSAREVFQGPDFWWKRIEPGPAPETSWLRSVLKIVLQALGRAWDAFWELIVRVLRFLFGRMPVESSGGKLLVWLLAGTILAESRERFAMRRLGIGASRL